MKKNVFKWIGILLLAITVFAAVPCAVAEGYAVSDNCVSLVARFETCYYKAVKEPSGVWRVGYGHTKNVTENTVVATEAEARALLKEDLARYASAVNSLIANKTIAFQMNQNRFDALTAFAFNCGNGNLEKLVKGRTAEEVAERILTYCKGGGKVLPTLVARRQAEKALFVR